MKENLKNLIAVGKTAQALEELRMATLYDPSLNRQVIIVAASFARYEDDKHLGVEDPSVLETRINRINGALVHIIDCLDDNKVYAAYETGASESFIVANPAQQIEITLKGSYEDFDVERFINVVSVCFNISKDVVKILLTMKGSIIIKLELPLDVATALVSLFENNPENLEDFARQLVENDLCESIKSIQNIDFPQPIVAQEKTRFTAQKIKETNDFCFQAVRAYLKKEDMYQKQVAEDLGAHLFADIFKRLETIENVKGYIYRSAKNNVARYSMQLKKEGFVPLDEADFDTRKLQEWQNSIVREDYNAFFEAQTTIIRQNLSHFEYVLLGAWSEKDRTYKELAEMFDSSEAAIRSSIARAREKCRKLLEEGKISLSNR